MRTAIIGGGASGMAAAIAAKECGADVTIYESQKRLGRKLLSTGNGRCNLTNMNAVQKNYHGNDTSFILPAFKKFWVTETLDFFYSLGVVTREEDQGKVYPYSLQASSVSDALRMRIEHDNICVKTEFEVKSIKKQNGVFAIESFKGEKDTADSVIVSCGGKAAPDLGSNGQGYNILRSFSHTITPVSPSLVQIKTEGDAAKRLKGIKINGAAFAGDIYEKGEILFTDYGLSGPPVFELSAYLDGIKTIALDLMPDYDRAEVEGLLRERIKNIPYATLTDFFSGMLNKRVGTEILRDLGIAPVSRECSSLAETEIKAIAEEIKGMSFKVSGTLSWNNAQVTRGGALTSEFDAETMGSKKVRGLFACGEILDIDGDCGGYNLQWAWSSGVIAGRNAAKKL